VSIRTTLNVSLTVELGHYIDRQIKRGRYRTASEMVRAALRLQQEREERLSTAETRRAENAPKIVQSS
jgi:antitoxin ParD1/3/4